MDRSIISVYLKYALKQNEQLCFHSSFNTSMQFQIYANTSTMTITTVHFVHLPLFMRIESLQSILSIVCIPDYIILLIFNNYKKKRCILTWILQSALLILVLTGSVSKEL